MCQFGFDIGIFETIRIIPNVAARLPADLTGCVAELSASDEMSALIQPSHLYYNSYYGVVSEWIATASAIAVREVAREGERRFCWHITCVMIVTGIAFLYAT